MVVTQWYLMKQGPPKDGQLCLTKAKRTGFLISGHYEDSWGGFRAVYWGRAPKDSVLEPVHTLEWYSAYWSPMEDSEGEWL